MEISTMSNSEITYDWNGQTIRFNDWPNDAYGAFEYVTRDGSHQFWFDLQPVGSVVRIYITSGPAYGNRDISGHSTHRHYDSASSRHYVCVREDLQPETVPEALSWAVFWAEATSAYIQTGRAFS
jgi:hypothetical protein